MPPNEPIFTLKMTLSELLEAIRSGLLVVEGDPTMSKRSRRIAAALLDLLGDKTDPERDL